MLKYNRHLDLDPIKNKALLVAYTRKTTLNIDGITIHSSIFTPFNYKDLPSLSFK